MISGCLSPGEALFMDLNIPKYFKKYKKYGNVSKNILFMNMKMLEIEKNKFLEQIWKRQAPQNDEDPLKKSR